MTALQELLTDLRDLTSQTEDTLREQVRQGLEPLVLAAEDMQHETEMLLARVDHLETEVNVYRARAEHYQERYEWLLREVAAES